MRKKGERKGGRGKQLYVPDEAGPPDPRSGGAPGPKIFLPSLEPAQITGHRALGPRARQGPGRPALVRAPIDRAALGCRRQGRAQNPAPAKDEGSRSPLRARPPFPIRPLQRSVAERVASATHEDWGGGSPASGTQQWGRAQTLVGTRADRGAVSRRRNRGGATLKRVVGVAVARLA